MNECYVLIASKAAHCLQVLKNNHPWVNGAFSRRNLDGFQASSHWFYEFNPICVSAASAPTGFFSVSISPSLILCLLGPSSFYTGTCISIKLESKANHPPNVWEINCPQWPWEMLYLRACFESTWPELKLERKYGRAPHDGILVKDVPLIWCWSHKIITELKNSYHLLMSWWSWPCPGLG